MLTAQNRLIILSSTTHLNKIMDVDFIRGMQDESAIEQLLKALKDRKSAIKKSKSNRSDKTKQAASELVSFTNNVVAAKDAYRSKGFNVIIQTDENGLIKKWSLKGKYTNRNIANDPAKSVEKLPKIKDHEFKKILPLLSDEFGANEIKKALIDSGIGERKLQPALGVILKDIYGDLGVKKVPGIEKGPKVRYRKVK